MFLDEKILQDFWKIFPVGTLLSPAGDDSIIVINLEDASTVQQGVGHMWYDYNKNK